MDIFKLNRYFWDYAFNNPEKIKPNHCAIYYFALEHCNRLGWKQKFGFPTSMVLEATGIKSYSVYKKTFDDLVEFGLFEVIEYSKNQYSSNIIALKENYKALDKALDKAFIKHDTKQSESTLQSNDSIDKQITINNKPIIIPFDVFWNMYNKKVGSKDSCISKWNKLKDEEKQKIIDTLPTFLSSIKDKQFQPHPQTYLNQKRWNDEIILSQQSELKFKCEDMSPFGFFYPLLTQKEFDERIKTNPHLRKL